MHLMLLPNVRGLVRRLLVRLRTIVRQIAAATVASWQHRVRGVAGERARVVTARSELGVRHGRLSSQGHTPRRMRIHARPIGTAPTIFDNRKATPTRGLQFRARHVHETDTHAHANAALMPRLQFGARNTEVETAIVRAANWHPPVDCESVQVVADAAGKDGCADASVTPRLQIGARHAAPPPTAANRQILSLTRRVQIGAHDRRGCDAHHPIYRVTYRGPPHGRRQDMPSVWSTASDGAKKCAPETA
jgi:hypothetical protein